VEERQSFGEWKRAELTREEMLVLQRRYEEQGERLREMQDTLRALEQRSVGNRE
jgi:hypothetical protein